MKKLIVIFGMVVALVGFMALSAQAQFTIWFAENGAATISYYGATYPYPGVIAPGPDGFPALAFTLPEAVGTGPVGVWDNAVGLPNALSDVLVFGSSALGEATTTMYFYSSPGPELADLTASEWAYVKAEYIGLYGTGVVQAGVDVAEAPNGMFTFNAGGGFVYNGVSSGVPEPATLLLLGSGLVSLVAFRKKFRA